MKSENAFSNNGVAQLLTSRADMRDVGLEYSRVGLSIIPVGKNKQPTISQWTPYQRYIADADTITSWNIANDQGVAIICGDVSGNLEALDFDEKYNNGDTSLFERWHALVDAHAPDLVDRLVREGTINKGYHVFYRCNTIGGNMKLAERPTTENEKQTETAKSRTLIETRGRGGYIIVYPSPGYSWISGSFSDIPEITAEERDILLSAARALNEYLPVDKVVTGLKKKTRKTDGKRPGEDFNERGNVHEFLVESGWTQTGTRDNQEYWLRPGKRVGVSATYHNELNTFYVFSSNADPFEPGKAYSKFAVFAYLKCDGDFEKAARELAALGFGSPTVSRGASNIVLVESFLNERYDFRMNAITRRVEFRDRSVGDFAELGDYELNSLYREVHHDGLLVSIDSLKSLLQSDFSEVVDPFEEYFSKLPMWDGVDHIADLADTVTLADPNEKDLFRLCLERWLIGQVACALNPKLTNQNAIILVGDQGALKTTWLNLLIPPSLSKYKFIGTIDPDNKDSLIYLAETMLINLDELETLRKADIGSLKSLMTMDAIKVRRPYDRYPTNLVRRASFVGSINQGEFLNDPTGSRRFLTFKVESLNANHGVDMDNVYAQAYQLFVSGERFWFDRQEIRDTNERNKSFSLPTYEREMLNKYFVPGVVSNKDGDWKNATEVATVIHQTDLNFRVDSKSVRDIGSALVHDGFPSRKLHGSKSYYVRFL